MTLACALALAAVFGITGCGGNGTTSTSGSSDAENSATATQTDQRKEPKLENFIWYKAAIPQGFEAKNGGVGDGAYCIELVKGRKSINAVLVNLEAEPTHKGWLSDGDTEDLGTVKLNGISWYASRTKDASATTTTLLADMTDARSARIELVNMDPDDKDARTYLESFTPSDAKSIQADYDRSIDTAFDDVVAEFGK